MFGAWLRLPGEPFAHYYLPGARACLCGSHRRPDPEARAGLCQPYRGGPAEDAACPDCKAVNELRWLGAYPRKTVGEVN